MTRRPVGTLRFSAAALVALFVFEGYTSSAIIPTSGDVPTIGFGTTLKQDGSKITLLDTTNPVQAAMDSYAHISRDEALFKASLPGVELTQQEYDIYVDWVYQYGIKKWNTSTVRNRLLTGDYRGACDALLMWKYAGGYDCSTTINGEPNKICWGVWARQLARNRSCLAAQGESHE